MLAANVNARSGQVVRMKAPKINGIIVLVFTASFIRNLVDNVGLQNTLYLLHINYNLSKR
jgi:hypothetical protein